jgi:hypothetical protein
MDPEIKVTRIKDRWHGRLILDEKVLDEMACDTSEDIGWICREMLRWYDKMGGTSQFASEARDRQVSTPIGKVWYKPALDEEKSKLQ